MTRSAAETKAVIDKRVARTRETTRLWRTLNPYKPTTKPKEADTSKLQSLLCKKFST